MSVFVVMSLVSGLRRSIQTPSRFKLVSLVGIMLPAPRILFQSFGGELKDASYWFHASRSLFLLQIFKAEMIFKTTRCPCSICLSTLCHAICIIKNISLVSELCRSVLYLGADYDFLRGEKNFEKNCLRKKRKMQNEAQKLSAEWNNRIKLFSYKTSWQFFFLNGYLSLSLLKKNSFVPILKQSW